jgi:outer membrane protein OmpA-like peptidoglycan-associated protein/Tol biopolymer transport system component
MKVLGFLLALLCLHYSAEAQTYDPYKINKRAMALYQTALNTATQGDYLQGIKLLQDAVKIEPRFLDAYLSIAGIYGEMKNYNQANTHYEKAKAVDSLYFKDYNLPYSINLAGEGEFEKALAAVNDFLTIPNLNPESKKAGDYRRKSYQFAIDYLRSKDATSYKFEPRNLGDSINSRVSEYYPTITLDGQQLIYTRRVNNFNEDFYGAEWRGPNWSAAHGLSGNINSGRNEGAQNISQDGQWLIFTGCNFPEGVGSCDLYISYSTTDGWSAPENLGRRINTDAWESAPSLSPDKRDLYFASNRPDGYGGSDIYVSRRLSNGLWSEPENLGASVNTAGDEGCPFIHADNQTLYFTSNGHPGFGGDDLFLVRREPKNTWSKPENLGYPINTIENEGSLVIAADGITAYYASDRSDSKGGLDLYSFELRNDVRPAKTLWVKGRVFDKKTLKGLPSAVELTDLASQEMLSKVQTDETGNYLVTLPIGKDYAFNVNRKGYLFFSANFPFSQSSPDSTYKIDIPLQPIEANATVVLQNIFFDVNKFELKPSSAIELDRIVLLMKENPTLRIRITGHTDNIGKPADNLKLSNNRAQAVVKYLSAKGIEAGRLSFRGFGEQKPVAGNEDDTGRAKNRRTELTVIAN